MHYSPLRRSSTPEGAFPLDLHALSTPPTFILSQDQTLQFLYALSAEAEMSKFDFHHRSGFRLKGKFLKLLGPES